MITVDIKRMMHRRILNIKTQEINRSIMRGVWFLGKKQYRELLGVTAQILHLLSQLIPLTQLQQVYNVKYFIILTSLLNIIIISLVMLITDRSQSNVLLFDN